MGGASLRDVADHSLGPKCGYMYIYNAGGRGGEGLPRDPPS